MLSGGENLGERYQNRIEKVSIPWLFLEPGLYGSIEILAFLMDRLQVFKLLYKPSKMFRIPGLLVVLRALLPWDQGEHPINSVSCVTICGQVLPLILLVIVLEVM